MNVLFSLSQFSIFTRNSGWRYPPRACSSWFALASAVKVLQGLTATTTEGVLRCKKYRSLHREHTDIATRAQNPKNRYSRRQSSRSRAWGTHVQPPKPRTQSGFKELGILEQMDL